MPANRSIALKRTWVSGSLAALFSSAVLAWMGRRERGSAADPVNAVSHWLWGDAAIGEQRVTLRHTAAGYLIHHGAALLWAWFHERLALRRPPRVSLHERLGRAVLVTTAAYVIDFRFTPRRLTPGFERRLSKPALWTVYAAFAAGLAAGAWLQDRER
jgi:hypothetical protein